jgi:D-glycero-beta-D-manno-heptose-7-phosphate kinase
MPDSATLRAYVKKFSNQNILIIGDLIADEFVYGEIARVSREAPVLILRHERTETGPGGAGNAAANLAALGVRTLCVGVVGRDRAGRQLTLSLRQRGADTHGVASLREHVTPTKTRILAGSFHAPRQQVIRVDREDHRPLPDETRNRLLATVSDLLPTATGVIVSDYGYGAASDGVLHLLRDWRRRSGIPIVADSRYRLAAFHGFTAATPNQEEAETACGERFADSAAAASHAEILRERLELDALLLTRGSEGMALAYVGSPPVTTPAVGALSPVDVTGAGDTVIATFTAALASGASFVEAMHLANCAAGLVVMKRGTATISQDELDGRLAEEFAPGAPHARHLAD